jgi:uncharacterized membrane protein YdbT with pleckstrin-like domain
MFSLPINYKTLGIKTLFLYTIERSIPAILLFFLGVLLPSISRFIITSTSFEVDPSNYALIDKVGNMVMALIIILAILALAIAIISSVVTYISTLYRLGEHSIRFRKGLISRMEVSIPYKQVQNVNIHQSIFLRILGLAKLVVFSAGGETAEGGPDDQVFRLVDINIAEEIKRELLERANIQRIIQHNE